MSLTETLAGIVGAAQVITDPDVLDGRSVDHTGRYRGHASALVRPGSADEVAAVLRACRDAGAYVTVQGGRTSLVAGTVPEHDDVLLSTERLRDVGEVDLVERRIRVGAGATLAEVQRAASALGLVFGVDLAARDSATVGGMASTNAGCAPSATGTWASRSSASMWRCPTDRWFTGTVRFAATTPDTTSCRCSSAPRARSASSPRWICGCIPHRRTGSPRSVGSTTSTHWSRPGG